MATFADLITKVRRDLRDTNASAYTWSDAEVSDMVDDGIDQVESLYPKEVTHEFVYTPPAISGGLRTVSLASTTSPINQLYRVEIWGSQASVRQNFQEVLEPGIGYGPASGWDIHDGVLHLPPYYELPNPCNIRLLGYGQYTKIGNGATSATHNLDQQAQSAVRTWVRYDAMVRLISDRVRFQQWQVAAGANDVSALQINQIAAQAASRWKEEQRRIKRWRRSG